jgi:hypothetical protein
MIVSIPHFSSYVNCSALPHFYDYVDDRLPQPYAPQRMSLAWHKLQYPGVLSETQEMNAITTSMEESEQRRERVIKFYQIADNLKRWYTSVRDKIHTGLPKLTEALSQKQLLLQTDKPMQSIHYDRIRGKIEKLSEYIKACQKQAKTAESQIAQIDATVSTVQRYCQNFNRYMDVVTRFEDYLPATMFSDPIYKEYQEQERQGQKLWEDLSKRQRDEIKADPNNLAMYNLHAQQRQQHINQWFRFNINKYQHLQFAQWHSRELSSQPGMSSITNDYGRIKYDIACIEARLDDICLAYQKISSKVNQPASAEKSPS